MFLEKINEKLESFSRNIEGYFLERNSDLIYDIDEKYLASIKEINKEAKRIFLKYKENRKKGNLELADKYFAESKSLMNKKDDALNALISKYSIKPIGYHSVHYSKSCVFLLYNINGYSFHARCELPKQELQLIKYLGVLNNSHHLDTLGKSTKKSRDALKVIDAII